MDTCIIIVGSAGTVEDVIGNCSHHPKLTSLKKGDSFDTGPEGFNDQSFLEHLAEEGLSVSYEKRNDGSSVYYIAPLVPENITSFLEMLSFSVMLFHSDGSLLYANNRGQDVLSSIGDSPFCLGEDALNKEKLMRVIDEKGEYAATIGFTLQDSEQYEAVTYRPFSLSRNNSVILRVGEDLTEQRNMVSMLTRSYEFIENVMNNVHPIFVADAEGVILLVNDPFTRLFHLDTVDIVGKRIDQLYIQQEKVAKAVENVMDTGSSVTGFKAKALCGTEECILSMSITAQKDPGSANSIVGIIQDITEQTRHEENLRTLSRAVEQSPASVVITDAAGVIQYVNPKFTRLTGYSSEEVVGQKPSILKSGKQSRDYYRELWQTITSGREWRGEFHNKKKSGELYWEFASINPVLNQDGSLVHYVAVKEDITIRKQYEDQLEQQNMAMLQELDYAAGVIRRLLPVRMPKPDYCRFHVTYRPLELVGGDFYDYYTLEDGSLGLFIGDVAGHGVSAALYLAMVKSSMERVVAGTWSDPHEVLQNLNSAIISSMSSYFLTAAFIHFIPGEEGVRVRFARAGHPFPLVHRDGGDIEFCESTGRPVGILDTIDSETKEISLFPGDRLYLYTDGIIETMNPQGEMLEEEGFTELIRNTSHLIPSLQQEEILQALDTLRDGESADDDIVLVTCEITGASMTTQ